ncbi:hypothetical protein Cch01nite_43250 [Cellulomonas chitinilytica]|uniref:DUF2255 family protein n=1 Tax=Cellulomonas chitinilytica TaxID=398759 RepID=A0A919U3T1_9CELL|nr:DUF2255 family protein [Cellulomonas chitinilytica]GIG23601.1 hypothetical protein Cch01nite_43250 [Cellulomonas chitinilytica]
MTDWDPADLAAIDHAGELRLAAHRPDGTLRPATVVWHVAVDGGLFVRSVRGDDGAWYRAVRRTGTGTVDAGGVHADVTFTRDDAHDPAVDRAYRAKYGDGSPVLSITAPAATSTTLRVDPR